MELDQVIKDLRGGHMPKLDVVPVCQQPFQGGPGQPRGADQGSSWCTKDKKNINSSSSSSQSSGLLSQSQNAPENQVVAAEVAAAAATKPVEANDSDPA